MATRQTDLDALAEAFAGVQRLGQPRTRATPTPGTPTPGTPTPGTPPRGPGAVEGAPRSGAAGAAPRPANPPAGVDDDAALHEALRGVRRLDPPAPRASSRPSLVPSELLRHLESQNEALTARVSGLERERDDARRAAHLASAGETAAVVRVEEISARLRELEAEGRTLRDRASERATGELRTLLVERGLRSEVEMTAALDALLEDGRFLPILGGLVVSRRAEMTAFLDERLILLAEGEQGPPGRAVVRVPGERSESREHSALRSALARFSTACLVAGKRRIVFVGGTPPHRKQLREGLDRRLDLCFLGGDQLRTPPIVADLVIVWGATELDHGVSANFPAALMIPHHGIVGMLQMVAERLGEAG
ncbi:MAG: hypothetical protein EXR71_13425 [Myxococcales bacterium]|nr:hypothetical protein [Myxococcales bacterium]